MEQRLSGFGEKSPTPMALETSTFSNTETKSGACVLIVIAGPSSLFGQLSERQTEAAQAARHAELRYRVALAARGARVERRLDSCGESGGGKNAWAASTLAILRRHLALPDQSIAQ